MNASRRNGLWTEWLQALLPHHRQSVVEVELGGTLDVSAPALVAPAALRRLFSAQANRELSTIAALASASDYEIKMAPNTD